MPVILHNEDGTKTTLSYEAYQEIKKVKTQQNILNISGVGGNNVVIGNNAGSKLSPSSNNVVIIGDNIPNLVPEDNTNVIFIGQNVAIGQMVCGEPCNLYSILMKFLTR